MALKGSTIITQNVCFVLEKHITPLDCLEPRSTPTANCSAGDEAVMARGACLSLLVSVASIVALVTLEEGESGSQEAGPIVRGIMDSYLNGVAVSTAP